MKLYVFKSCYVDARLLLNIGTIELIAGYVYNTNFMYSQLKPSELEVPWYYL